MTRKLIFIKNRETFAITIIDKEIFYCDRKWKKQVRMIPKDERLAHKIKMSRNRIPPTVLNMFKLTDKEQKEYDNAKDDDALAVICIRDARKKGAKLIKDEVTE